MNGFPVRNAQDQIAARKAYEANLFMKIANNGTVGKRLAAAQQSASGQLQVAQAVPADTRTSSDKALDLVRARVVFQKMLLSITDNHDAQSIASKISPEELRYSMNNFQMIARYCAKQYRTTGVPEGVYIPLVRKIMAAQVAENGDRLGLFGYGSSAGIPTLNMVEGNGEGDVALDQVQESFSDITPFNDILDMYECNREISTLAQTRNIKTSSLDLLDGLIKLFTVLRSYSLLRFALSPMHENEVRLLLREMPTKEQVRKVSFTSRPQLLHLIDEFDAGALMSGVNVTVLWKQLRMRLTMLKRKPPNIISSTNIANEPVLAPPNTTDSSVLSATSIPVPDVHMSSNMSFEMPPADPQPVVGVPVTAEMHVPLPEEYVPVPVQSEIVNVGPPVSAVVNVPKVPYEQTTEYRRRQQAYEELERQYALDNFGASQLEFDPESNAEDLFGYDLDKAATITSVGSKRNLEDVIADRYEWDGRAEMDDFENLDLKPDRDVKRRFTEEDFFDPTDEESALYNTEHAVKYDRRFRVLSPADQDEVIEQIDRFPYQTPEALQRFLVERDNKRARDMDELEQAPFEPEDPDARFNLGRWKVDPELAPRKKGHDFHVLKFADPQKYEVMMFNRKQNEQLAAYFDLKAKEKIRDTEVYPFYEDADGNMVEETEAEKKASEKSLEQKEDERIANALKPVYMDDKVESEDELEDMELVADDDDDDEEDEDEDEDEADADDEVVDKAKIKAERLAKKVEDLKNKEERFKLREQKRVEKAQMEIAKQVARDEKARIRLEKMTEKEKQKEMKNLKKKITTEEVEHTKKADDGDADGVTYDDIYNKDDDVQPLPPAGKKKAPKKKKTIDLDDLVQEYISPETSSARQRDIVLDVLSREDLSGNERDALLRVFKQEEKTDTLTKYDPNRAKYFNSKLKPRSGGGIEKSEKYVPFGKYFIHQHKLHNGIVAIKRSGGATISQMKPSKVSTAVADAMTRLLHGEGFLDGDEFSDADYAYLRKVLATTELSDRLKLKTPPISHQKAVEDNYEIMVGELRAGNNSKELLLKIRNCLLLKYRNGEISKHELDDVLQDIDSYRS